MHRLQLRLFQATLSNQMTQRRDDVRMAGFPSAPIPGPAAVTEKSGLTTPSQLRDLAPGFNRLFFTCSSCGVAASQAWQVLQRKEWRGSREFHVKIEDLSMCTCGACGQRSLWFESQKVYPRTSDAPAMSPDMPQSVRRDYEEAAAIASDSPRAAAALLRMCIEGLCKEISGKPKFDAAMDELARRGIPEEIETAMDVIRMNGNEVMHAGRLYGQDDAGTVSMLFRLANVIVTWAITDRKMLQSLYTDIPADKREAVAKRRADARARGAPTPTSAIADHREE